ncbi:Hypothetical predicted protein [Mytilus galloprovincialis]|uniref:Uncharacterized protein n=1 Tax=Mytilus galloprovincialis TaxID=29158 RepID=A0A8B6G5Z5_MYTGA|nr:Hypothetical predicted protein [Mytilus galloprovincialis]
MSTKSDRYLLVAALDFGTTYSGYAYALRGDFKTEPLKIQANQAWNSGSSQHWSLKTPTCLLLDKNKEFKSFGYDAENTYSDLVLDEEQSNYYFFNRFKMKLHKNKHLSSELILEDVTGKSVSAINVFALSIKALVDHLLELLEKRGTGMSRDDVRWVLTLPAIWTDSAKQFMRKAANKAGIPDKNLFIALEPEAASIYCQYLPTEKLHGAETGFHMSSAGTRYMIVDLGGGTADITLHEKLPDGQLKEICRADGNDCGGTSVDNAFFQLFVKIVGAPLMNTMKLKEPGAYLDIFRAFENVKRTIDTTTTGKVNVTFPFATFDSLCQKHLSESFDSALASSKYKGDIIRRGDKIRFEVDLMKSLFAPTIDGIISLVKSVLEKREARKTSLIIMVGGFSECRLIQAGLRKQFPKHRIIVPEQADLAVLKGAVLFGQKPSAIQSRVIKTTYGVAMTAKFDPTKHDQKHKSVIAGVEKTRNLFDVIMKENSSVPVGTKITKSYSTTMEKQNEIKLSVYTTNNAYPKYVDEKGCYLLGEIVMAIEDPSDEKRWFDIEFEFGKTEVSAVAMDKKSRQLCKATFNIK